MSLLAWISVTVLAGCILGGVLCVWVSDDDPAAHAERDAKEPPPPLRARDGATLDEIARDFERVTGEKWPGPKIVPRRRKP